jgi:hypothetical protein
VVTFRVQALTAAKCTALFGDDGPQAAAMMAEPEAPPADGVRRPVMTGLILVPTEETPPSPKEITQALTHAAMALVQELKDGFPQLKAS